MNHMAGIKVTVANHEAAAGAVVMKMQRYVCEVRLKNQHCTKGQDTFNRGNITIAEEPVLLLLQQTTK